MSLEFDARDDLLDVGQELFPADVREVVDEVPEHVRQEDPIREDVGVAQERRRVQSEHVEEVFDGRDAPALERRTSFAVGPNRVIDESWTSASPWTAAKGSFFIWSV